LVSKKQYFVKRKLRIAEESVPQHRKALLTVQATV
jgi:hypothetical protein